MKTRLLFLKSGNVANESEAERSARTFWSTHAKYHMTCSGIHGLCDVFSRAELVFVDDLLEVFIIHVQL